MRSRQRSSGSRTGGGPPNQSTLTSELARITNLEGEVDLDAVAETFLAHLERRLSADEEAWRRIQTPYVQDQFEENEGIRETLESLSEDLQTAVEEETHEPILEIAHFEPVSADWSSRMFETLDSGGSEELEPTERNFFDEMMGFFGNTAIIQLSVRNVTPTPVISPRLGVRLTDGDVEYASVFPISVDDIDAGLPFLDDRTGAPTTIGPESMDTYITYIVSEADDLPEAGHERVTTDLGGEFAATTVEWA